MSQPFKVDFLFKLCQFTVGCCVSQVAWKYVLCFFVFVFLRSSSILNYVEVVFLQFMTIRPSCIFKEIEVVFHLKKLLRLSYIFKTIEVFFHFQKKSGCLPFSKKLRSSSNSKKMRSSFIFEYLRLSSIVKKLRSSSIKIVLRFFPFSKIRVVLQISSSWVEPMLHTEFQLHMLPR